MNIYVRALSCLALLGLSLTALSQYRPAWAVGMSLDWWNLPELREEVRRGRETDAALDRAAAGALPRAEAKDQVTCDFLAGRLSLTEAAARFRAIDRDNARALAMLRVYYPAATDEELRCRQVISWATGAAETPTDPESGNRTRRRLEAELIALLEKNHGVITLPE